MKNLLLPILTLLLICFSCDEPTNSINTNHYYVSGNPKIIDYTPNKDHVRFLFKDLIKNENNFLIMDSIGSINPYFFESKYVEDKKIIYDESELESKTWYNYFKRYDSCLTGMTYDSIDLLNYSDFDTIELTNICRLERRKCEDCMRYIDISYPVYIDGKIGLRINVIVLGPWECSHHYILLLNGINMSTEQIYYGPFLN